MPASLIERVSSQPWETLADVAHAHGPSFYMADPDVLGQNLSYLQAAFTAIYPNTSLAYSYKTNYLPRFALRAHEFGAYAEVVSRLELDLALALGIPGDRIIFNGPIKTDDDLSTAFGVRALVHADSLQEIQRIIESDHPGEERRVAIRCHLGEQTAGSRFGIDLTMPQAREAIDALEKAPATRLVGLHVHYNGGRLAEGYGGRIRSLIQIHEDVLQGRSLEYIDIGGGFAGPMSPALAGQFSTPPPSFEDYARAIATPMAEAYGASGPALILEPGMAVLADAMVFVTRVGATKRLGNRDLAVVDGSLFSTQPLFSKVNLPIRAIQRATGHGAAGLWDVVGHTCMEIDVLHRGYEGAVAVGDFVAFENVGAYTNVLNAPFIRGTPAILELTGDEIGPVLRRESNADDLLASYQPSP